MDDEQFETMIETMGQRIKALEERHTCESAPDLPPCAMLEELEAGLGELREWSKKLLYAWNGLEEEGQRYRELIEFAPDGYLATDPAGTIRAANQKAAAMLGVPRESLTGKALTVCVASQGRDAFATRLERLINDGRVTDWEVTLQTRNGGRLVASVTAVTARDALGNATGVHWMLHDVTDRRRAEAANERYVNRLEVFRQMDLAMLTATSLKRTVELALEHLWRLVPCRRASVGLIDQRKGEMTTVAVLVDGVTSIPEGTTTPILTFETPPSPRQWRIVDDIRLLENPTPWERAMRDEGLRTMVNVPLMVQGEWVGSLNLGLVRPDQLGPEDRDLVQEVADRLAVAIQQAHLLDQVREHAVDLENRVAERTAELRASEERLRLVLQRLPAIVWTTDRELNITSVSGSGLAAMRLSPEQLIGGNLRDLQRLIRMPVALADAHERALRGERVTFGAGSRGRMYQNRVEPFLDEDAAIVGCLGVAVDVTNLKQTEQALRETKDRLERVNRRLHALNAIELGAQELLEVEDITALVVRQLRTLGIESAVVLRERGILVVRSVSLEADQLARVEAILGVPLLGPVSPEGAEARFMRTEARETVWLPDAVKLIAEMIADAAPRAVARAARLVGLRGAIVSPLVARGTNIGLLVLWGNDVGQDDVPAVAGFANRLAVAIDNAALFGTIRQQGQRLRSMAGRLADMDEADRRLAARALHDEVGQTLSALSLSLSALRDQANTLSEGGAALFRQRIDDALDLARKAAVWTRDIMADLRPPVLDDYGLMAALRWHAEGLQRRTSLTVTLRGKEPEPRLPAPVENALFRIAQEALMNVARHAGTNQAWVTLETDEKVARLVVSDAGAGFDLGQVAEPEGHAGLGLVTIQERAEAVGGRSRVESQPGKGTRITVEVLR